MKIVYLCPSINKKAGWSRYAHDVIVRTAVKADVTVLCHEITENVDASIAQKAIFRRPHYYLSSPLWVLVDGLRIRRAVKAELQGHTDAVIHCMTEVEAMFAPFLRGLGAKIVMTTHGTYSVFPLLSWKTRWWYKMVYRAVDRVVSVSHFTKKHLLSHASSFIPEDKIFVMTNGVDFEERTLQEKSSEPFSILTVGEVKHRKGAHHVVRVAHALRTTYDFPFKITFVGKTYADKGFHKDLEAYIEEHNLADCVEFAGMVPQEELDAQYKKSNLFMLLSVHEGGHYEGYPLVFHEAAMWGLPTIGTFHCGAEDAINDGVTGVLVHPEDHANVADVIAKIHTNDINIPPKACQDWARENDWSKKDLFSMYKDL